MHALLRRYHTDPSGTFTQYEAKAIGAGSEGAQTSLQEHYNKSMRLHEAQKLALEILRQVMEEKLDSSNVELSVVTTASREFRICTKDELEVEIYYYYFNFFGYSLFFALVV